MDMVSEWDQVRLSQVVDVVSDQDWVGLGWVRSGQVMGVVSDWDWVRLGQVEDVVSDPDQVRLGQVRLGYVMWLVTVIGLGQVRLHAGITVGDQVR